MKLLSDATAERLVHLLNAHAAGGGWHKGGAARWAFVRCTSATPIGGNTVLAQCYPGIILSPASDYPAPPEDGFGCLLTLLGDGGVAAVPRSGGVYECLITGEVESDGSGSLAGRPRAFAALALGDIPNDYAPYTSETVISAANAWQDVVSIALPDAGTYLIFATLSARLDMTALGAVTYSFISMDVYDATALAEVPGTQAVAVTTNQTAKEEYGTVTICVPYTVTGASTVTLRARWAAGVGATALISNIYSAAGTLSSGVGYARLTDVSGGAGPKGDTGATGATGPAAAPDDANIVIGLNVFGF